MVFRRILVIQTAFIGDVILATSLLETLHSALPDSRIDVLVRKGNESLFRGHPFLSEVLVWDKKGGKYRNLFKLLGQIRKNSYDAVINLQRYSTTGFLTVLSGARMTIGFSKNPLSRLFSRRYPHRFENGMHETWRNHLLLESITQAPLQKPRLYPLEDDLQKIASLQEGPYYCIAPTSVWFTKQFPVDQWVKLVDQLPQSHRIYLLGAPADGGTADELIRKSARDGVINLCGKLSFLQSAALMKGAALNYVNDSAPMHLCSAVDAPVCAVYCSTIPAFGYGPLSAESYMVETHAPLTCRPCGLHGHKACPEGHFACATGIEIRELAALAARAGDV